MNKFLLLLLANTLLLAGITSCDKNDDSSGTSDFEVPELTLLNTIQFTVDIKSAYSVEVILSGRKIAVDWGDGDKIRCLFNTAEIKKRYDIWVNRISQTDMAILSDPNDLVNNREGEGFIAYCKNNKKDALAFFVDLYFNQTDDNAPKQISYYMFCEIFYEYAEIIESIKTDWGKYQYDFQGAYIAPTPEMFMKKYAKKLINTLL